MFSNVSMQASSTIFQFNDIILPKKCSHLSSHLINIIGRFYRLYRKINSSWTEWKSRFLFFGTLSRRKKEYGKKIRDDFAQRKSGKIFNGWNLLNDD